MTNFEVMKKDILSQIENMDIERFYDFLGLLNGEVPNSIDTLIDAKNIFRCINCEKMYGKCALKRGIDLDDITDDECLERFTLYSKSEIK